MAGVKKFLDFFVKVEPEAPSGGPGLSDEELQKILAEEEAPAKPAARPARGAPPAPPQGGARGTAAPPAPAQHPAGAPQRVRDVAAPVVARMTAPGAASPPPAMPSGGAASGPNGGALPDFPTIYQLAKVPAPAHGYDVSRVETMLANPRLQGMAPSIKANSVHMALEVAGVQIDEVIADAVARDKAIDEFEGWWAGKVSQLEAEKRAENAAIEDEINKYLEAQRERIRANNAAVQAAQETFAQWLVLKAQEEQRLYNVVSPFVTENPVTLNTGLHRTPAGLAGEAPFGGAGAPGPSSKK